MQLAMLQAADNSLTARQFYRQKAGHALTWPEFKKQETTSKWRVTILAQAAKLPENQSYCSSNQRLPRTQMEQHSMLPGG